MDPHERFTIEQCLKHNCFHTERLVDRNYPFKITANDDSENQRYIYTYFRT